MEESIAKQKSRVSWLKLGDTNAAYFHACLKNKQVQNQIRRLKTKNGNIISSDHEIEQEVVNFYKELLQSTGSWELLGEYCSSISSGSP